MHCEDPGCLKACPAPGAIVQYANGIVDFISENCIGCGYCVKGCPFNVPRVSKVDHKSYKCTLCSDRVGVGLEPACVKSCPTGAIMFGSKTDMTDWAGERIIDLKSRGFENAGLYDPPGVGGTHVMYVLHHADKPSLYAGLPDNPKISVFVEVWKGVLKPLALAGIALTAVAGFLHWVTAGPNEVQPEDDIAAAKLIQRDSARAKSRATPHESSARDDHSQHAGGADQSLDHRGLLHPADAVRPVDVSSAVVLAFRLFGGGQWARAIHPWIGCVLLVSYAGLIVQFWRDNFWNRDDVAWMSRSARARQRGGRRAGGPAVQRRAKIRVLVDGAAAARAAPDRPRDLGGLFRRSTTIETQRIAALIHSYAAIAAIIIWIIHVYAAIWVRGSMRGMTQGYVTPGWAWRHHRKWLRSLVATGSRGPRPRRAAEVHEAGRDRAERRLDRQCVGRR